MAKKATIILFLILITLLFVPGCSNKTETSPENSIPFLTFSVNQKANDVEAYLNYWDVTKGKIIQTNKVMYVVTAPPNRTTKPGIWDWDLPVSHFGPPLSWDGENYIYLSSKVHKPENIPNFLKLKMFDDPRVPAIYSNGKEIKYDFVYAYSKNLQEQEKNVGADYLKEKYGDFTFRVFDDNGEKIMEKNIKISLYNNMFHGGVSSGEAYLYEKAKKEVKELFLYYDSRGIGHFLICTINLEKGTYKWNEVSGIKGCIPPMNRFNVSIIGSKFYVPLCGRYIGIINPDNYTGKIFDIQEELKSLSFYRAPVSCGGVGEISGEFKNFLILSCSVVYGKNESGTLPENYKHLWILFDTRTNKISQIIEWDSLDPQFIVVRGINGKELSKLETDKLVKNISKVYDVNGVSYVNSGRFIVDNFIRFPHINGG